MAPSGQSPSTIERAAERGSGWVAVALALGLAFVTGILGVFLHWSLQRPQDWSSRWQMEDEFTEDQGLHHARLAHGARLGPGKIGGGVNLPGKESLVVLDGWNVAEQWTIELWVQALKPTADLQLIAGAGQTKGAYGVGLSKGTFAAMYYDPQGNRAWLSSGIKPSTNRWYHLAATCDGRLASLYVDGVLCSTTNAGTRRPTDPGSGMHLGASHLSIAKGLLTTNSFTGNLDHLSVYARALKKAEVRALYRSTAFNPAGRRLASDILVSLSLALLLTVGFGCLARWWHPKSAGLMNLRMLTKSYRAVIAVLLVGLTLTGCLFLATHRQSTELDQRRFHQLIAEFLDRFDTRTESYVQQLTALRNWLSGEQDLTLEKWDLMIESMQLWNDYPGLFSVGFAPTVPAKHLTAFETWARGNIETNFAVHWLSANSNRMAISQSGCSNCSVLLPLTFHSHVYKVGDRAVRRKTAWGRDLLDRSLAESLETNPPIFAVVGRASRSQEINAGEPEELYPPENSNPSMRGTRVFLGVFTTRTNFWRVGQPASSAPPGQKTNLGVLFGSFCWQQFFDSMLGAQQPEIRFTLVTSRRQGAPFILADWGPPSAPFGTSGGSLKTSYQSRFYGRRLHFEFETLPAFAQRSERRWPSVIGGIGVAFSLGMALLVFIQARARLKEVATGRALRHSRDQLHHLLQDRERISRDLHDSTIQSIYGIGLGLKRSQKLIDRDPLLARTQLGESISELDSTISDLRQFILRMEPEVSGGESLTCALEALLQRTRRSTAARIQMKMEEGIENALTPHLAIHVMNLIREGLSNSVRHSSATTITVTLQRDVSRLNLQIADDGCGFDSDTLSAAGSGLRNMRARVKELNGSFSISSAPGSGTVIVVSIPLDTAPDNAHPTSYIL